MWSCKWDIRFDSILFDAHGGALKLKKASISSFQVFYVDLVTIGTLFLFDYLTSFKVITHLYYLDSKFIFSRHFHHFFTVFGVWIKVYVDLINHETFSDISFCLLPNVLILLYSNNVFLNDMTIYKNLNKISQK